MNLNKYSNTSRYKVFIKDKELYDTGLQVFENCSLFQSQPFTKLEIKPCGHGSRIRDIEAESHK